jgi:exodeoxyribonuclease VII large subunit
MWPRSAEGEVHRFSVSGLVDEVDALLRSRFPSVLVEGEIAELSIPASGHAFFRLVDEKASVSAVAWRTDWQAMRYRPKVGERVAVLGRVAIYGARGSFQIYARDIRPVGEGALAKELAARRARLEAEGLLDPRRKRALPAVPRFVGVATSLKGAALQDFLRVSGERWPAARILVAGCLVQGPQAPSEILRAVELLLEDGRAEVIVVTRGGGAAEDLMAFQDEQLARILAHSPVPWVSAVGHEVDTTLCDLVADVSVPTPTAAAVRVFPDGPALAGRIEDWHLRLETSFARVMERRRARLDELVARLRHPARRLAEVRRTAEAQRERLDRAFRARIDQHRVRLEDRERRLAASIRPNIERARGRWAPQVARLEALSPQAVLDRGYAVVWGPSGVAHGPSDLPDGAAVRIRLSDGQVEGRLSRT